MGSPDSWDLLYRPADLKFIKILSDGIKSTCHLVCRSSKTAGTTFGKYIKKKKACATMSGSNSIF